MMGEEGRGQKNALEMDVEMTESEQNVVARSFSDKYNIIPPAGFGHGNNNNNNNNAMGSFQSTFPTPQGSLASNLFPFNNGSKGGEMGLGSSVVGNGLILGASRTGNLSCFGGSNPPSIQLGQSVKYVITFFIVFYLQFLFDFTFFFSSLL
jgi:hypothetical protein